MTGLFSFHHPARQDQTAMTKDPNTSTACDTGITGETVEQVREHSTTGMIGVTGKVNYYVYSSNSRSLATGQSVAISSELENRPGYTGKTGQTAAAVMPGKLGARKTGVHRTPTEEGFCFGTPAGIL